MDDAEALRIKLASEQIPCSDDEFAVLLAGLPSARASVERLWTVDCGDLPPAAQLVENDSADD